MGETRLPVGRHCSTIVGVDGKPLLTCPPDWNGPLLERKEIPGALECGAQYSGMPMVIVPLRGHGKRRFRSGSTIQEFYTAPPNILIYGETFERDHGRWDGEPGESITLSLPTSVLNRYGQDDRYRFDTRFNNVDPTLRNAITALAEEMQCGFQNGRLYAEGLSISIVGWLMTHYAAKSPGTASPKRGLSAAQQARIEEFIDSHLDQNISIECMAAQVRMSPRLFSRVFPVAYGESPHRYVMLKRLARAKQLLSIRPNLTILDVALSTGFCSQAHFCFAFRKFCGGSPTAWRDND